MNELATNPQVMAMASALVHAQEIIDQIKAGKDVPLVDFKALDSSLDGCRELLKHMDNLALLPVRRDGVKP